MPSRVEPSVRLAVLLLALAFDRLWGEPPNAFHPVVWLGRLIGGCDALASRLAPVPAAGDAVSARESRAPVRLVLGVVSVAATLSAAALPAVLAERWMDRLPSLLRLILLAAALKPAFAWRSLEEHVARVERALLANDLPGARAALSFIVSRPTAALDSPRVAAGAIESLAENLSDSITAPLLWYAVVGLPGAWFYRAANTLDAMIGYRTLRYEHFGKPAARLDDLLSWLPARLTAACIVVVAYSSGDVARARAVLRRDGAATASPNAGRPMAAMAGALGVELEKVGHYRLGAGLRRPQPADVTRALRVARLAAVGAVALTAAVTTLKR